MNILSMVHSNSLNDFSNLSDIVILELICLLSLILIYQNHCQRLLKSRNQYIGGLTRRDPDLWSGHLRERSRIVQIIMRRNLKSTRVTRVITWFCICSQNTHGKDLVDVEPLHKVEIHSTSVPTDRKSLPYLEQWVRRAKENL